ncbi:MAG: hypothetical protein EPO40_18495 [Myxococcaceae bacterium]|nr:MAG: hypothetical protein EPO40_18495 [Myxococcaceae bacterium]
MKKKIGFVAAVVRGSRALALAGSLLVAGCAHRAVAPSPTTPAAPSSAAVDLREVTLAVDAVGGRRVDLAALRGRAIVVAALSTNDLGGHALARNLERLAAAHGDDLAVLVLATDGYDAPTLQVALEVFAEVVGLHHAAVAPLPAEVRAGSTPFGEVGLAPLVFLVNRAGRVARRLEGYQTMAALQSLIAPALPPGH